MLGIAIDATLGDCIVAGFALAQGAVNAGRLACAGVRTFWICHEDAQPACTRACLSSNVSPVRNWGRKFSRQAQAAHVTVPVLALHALMPWQGVHRAFLPGAHSAQMGSITVEGIA